MKKRPGKARFGVAAQSWGRFRADGLIEAAWIAAVSVVPLLMNQYALEGYQPNKVAMVRSLALMILTVWGVRAIGRRTIVGPKGSRSRGLSSWIAALGLFAGAYVLGTLFSVDRIASFWGSYNYQEGTLTFLGEAVLFFAVGLVLNTTAQAHRLITACLVASFPVSVYAVLQGAGLDPLTLDTTFTRAYSTLGQPIYLADYLAMLFPLTVWRVVRLIPNVTRSWTKSKREFLLLGFYAGLAILQLAAFFFSGSRGPLVGLALALAFLGLLWALHQRRWKLLAGQLALLGCGGLFFVLFNLQGGPFSRLAALPSVEHFSETLPINRNPDQFRDQLWAQAVPLMRMKNPLPCPVGGEDTFHFLRPWIGYGPETLQHVLPESFAVQPAWARIEDRFHDLIWDLWSSLGVLGVTAFLSLVLLLFFRAYTWLRLIPSRRDTLLFCVATSGLGWLGALALGFRFGPGFTGPGLLGGIVAGLAVYPLGILALRRPPEPEPVAASASASLVFALLAGILAHLAGLMFAFSVAASDVLFWIFAGMVVALTRPEDGEDAQPNAPVMPARSGASSRGWMQNPSVIGAWSTLLILFPLLFGFVHLYFFDDLSLGDILSQGLTLLPGGGPSHLLALLLIPTGLVSAFVFVAEAEGSAPSLLPHFFKAFLLSACIAAAYALLEAALIAQIGPIPRVFADPADALAQDTGYEVMGIGFFVLIFLVVAAGGFLLGPMSEGTAKSAWRPVRAAVAGVIFIGLVWFAGVGSICADMSEGWSRTLEALHRPQQSLVTARRAVSERPACLIYRARLASLAWNLALTGGSLQSVDDTMREAEQALLESERLSQGRDSCEYALASVYASWSTQASSPAAKAALVEKADQADARALIYQPGFGSALDDRARLDALSDVPSPKPVSPGK